MYAVVFKSSSKGPSDPRLQRDSGVEAWQIGNEGGFLPAPVSLTADNGNRLLMGLAERADIIVDFTNVPLGSHLLRNVGPDEPFGGGEPGEPPEGFEPSDPDTTGQIMEFRVVPALTADGTTPPQFLQLPAITPLPAETVTRGVAMIEKAGVGFDADTSRSRGRSRPSSAPSPTGCRWSCRGWTR